MGRRTGMTIVLDAHACGRLLVVLEDEGAPVLGLYIIRFDVDGRLPLAAAGPKDGAPVRSPWSLEEENASLERSQQRSRLESVNKYKHW